MNIRFQLLTLLTILYFSSCQQSQPEEAEAKEATEINITLEEKKLDEHSPHCTAGVDSCAHVEVTYFKATGTPTALQDSLNNYIQNLLIRLQLDFDPDANTLAPAEDPAKKLASSFLQQYDAYATDASKSGFPVRPWELTVNAGLLYKSASVLSVKTEQYSNTGGAHPNSSTALQSFDVAGKRLLLSEMVTDTAVLIQQAEKALRQKFPQLQDKPLAEAGLLLDSDALPLPLNSALSADGLLLHYNPYEIAPYVFGHIQLLLPYSQLENIIKPAYKP
ncbi:DUF3298 and DUF4163 domain-containing protein [Pontibacter sp. 13R65]|uniref:DUF3298 and DUF4163 domain-containing protein n=1 Tax=Pontibacter sp. 13R65 TaxID=3127458 RepID=UPI00301C0F1C